MFDSGNASPLSRAYGFQGYVGSTDEGLPFGLTPEAFSGADEGEEEGEEEEEEEGGEAGEEEDEGAGAEARSREHAEWAAEAEQGKRAERMGLGDETEEGEGGLSNAKQERLKENGETPGAMLQRQRGDGSGGESRGVAEEEGWGGKEGEGAHVEGVDAQQGEQQVTKSVEGRRLRREKQVQAELLRTTLKEHLSSTKPSTEEEVQKQRVLGAILEQLEQESSGDGREGGVAEEEEEKEDDDTGQEWESVDGNEPEVEVTVTVEGSEQKERGRDDAYNCEVGPGF
jgi:hypothetical protein